jgi:glycosyltransferase involved in cell wall biosynthesis
MRGRHQIDETLAMAEAASLAVQPSMTNEAGSRAAARVAIFIDNFSATGVVINAIAIARYLHERGCIVQLIAAQAEGALIDTVPDGINIVGLLAAQHADSPRHVRLRGSALAFRRRLREFSPHILFSAGNHGHLVSVLVSLALPNCRTIVRVSNDLDHMINGKPVKPLSRWWRVSKFWAVAALAEKMVFVSRHLLRSKAVTAQIARKAVVIPNGVDAAAIRRKAKEPCSHPWLSNLEEAPLVLAVGRLALQKNFSNLLRAIAIARQSKPVRLLVIGSGPLRAELLEEASSLGIGDAVEILAPIANPMPFVARASVLALPSWWEGSSNVLLEALACGTPIVASHTAGNAEDVLDFGRYGLLVDPDDPEGMAAALLVQSGSEAQMPGERALDFNREATLSAYCDLIMEQAKA